MSNLSQQLVFSGDRQRRGGEVFYKRVDGALNYAVLSVLMVALLALASRIIFDRLQAALLDIRHNRRF